MENNIKNQIATYNQALSLLSSAEGITKLSTELATRINTLVTLEQQFATPKRKRRSSAQMLSMEPKIVREYNRGYKIKHICKIYDIYPTDLYRIIRKYGIQTRRND